MVPDSRALGSRDKFLQLDEGSRDRDGSRGLLYEHAGEERRHKLEQPQLLRRFKLRDPEHDGRRGNQDRQASHRNEIHDQGRRV